MTNRKVTELGQLDLFDDGGGGGVGEACGDSLHQFVGVVAGHDDGVGAMLGGVLHHHDEGVLAGFFAELGVEGDVAAEDGLEAGADGGEEIAGTDDDAAHDAEVADDLVAGKFERGGDHRGVEGGGGTGVGRRVGIGGHAVSLRSYGRRGLYAGRGAAVPFSVTGYRLQIGRE